MGPMTSGRGSRIETTRIPKDNMTNTNNKILINMFHSLSSCFFDAAEALKRATPDDDSFDLDSHDTDRPIPFRISDEADAKPEADETWMPTPAVAGEDRPIAMVAGTPNHPVVFYTPEAAEIAMEDEIADECDDTRATLVDLSDDPEAVSFIVANIIAGAKDGIGAVNIMKYTGYSKPVVTKAIKTLIADGKIYMTGNRRGSRYHVKVEGTVEEKETVGSDNAVVTDYVTGGDDEAAEEVAAE